MFGRFCSVPSAAVAICPNVGWQKDFADPQTFLAPTFSGDNILRAGNANWSQLDDRGLNEQMRATRRSSPTLWNARTPGRTIDEEITRLAPAIPWLWPRQANIRSENVVGTIDEDNAVWSLAHTRLR